MSGMTKAEADEWVVRFRGGDGGRSQSNVVYNENAKIYEEVITLQKWQAPVEAAQTVSKLCPDKNSRILDVGAGTGLVGEELRKLGFSRLEALDPSEGMLALAEKKNIYLRLICACLSDQPLDIPPDTYDVIVGAGCMGENQLPSSAFIEMARILKPGGVIVMATKESHMVTCRDYVENFERVVQQLEQEGKLKLEQRYNYPNYHNNILGLMLVFRGL